METYQVVLLALAAIIILLKIRKSILSRGIASYNSIQVKQMLKESRNVILLDVRTDNERKAGYIKPSQHIPLHEISLKADQLKKFKDKEIICYCQSGSRSISAAIKLNKMGFNAANMTGGYMTW